MSYQPFSILCDISDQYPSLLLAAKRTGLGLPPVLIKPGKIGEKIVSDIATWGPGPGIFGNADHPYDGKLITTEEFRPGMVPYRILVADERLNQIVPVCTSSTYIAWGSLRLEPIWIHLGKVAGFAICQALTNNEPINRLDVPRFQRPLINQRREVQGHPKRAEREPFACHGECGIFEFNASTQEIK
jgi:hypothetical protein